MSKFYGISVGPGDPELITIKAKRIMDECKVIATPVTDGDKTLALDIASGCTDLSDKDILKLKFLMVRDRNALRDNHKMNAEIIKKSLDEGLNVAMLNLGDASVYSSFSYIASIIEEMGYEVEVIPGVTSFCATAAKLNESLTTMHKPLHVFPAGEIENIMDMDGTKIVMKSGKAIKDVKKKLKGRNVKAVSNCGLPDEKICHNLEEISDEAGYYTTLIIK